MDGLPGLGFPRWRVDLLRVRNGQGGSWILEWADGKFVAVEQTLVEQQVADYDKLLA
jgi:protein ImuA